MYDEGCPHQCDYCEAIEERNAREARERHEAWWNSLTLEQQEEHRRRMKPWLDAAMRALEAEPLMTVIERAREEHPDKPVTFTWDTRDP